MGIFSRAQDEMEAYQHAVTEDLRTAYEAEKRAGELLAQKINQLVYQLKAAEDVVAKAEELIQEHHVDFARDGMRFPALAAAVKRYRGN